ncbi:MAG TPA: hypothetical protein PK239_00150 [Chitinophagales bacterium]|nr:hypothetical protein [Chitinophagales bacterium]HRK25672.1 hypothetical protein [Chitinophagales bacterium]
MTQNAAIAYIAGVHLLPLFVAPAAAIGLIYSSFAQELHVLKNGKDIEVEILSLPDNCGGKGQKEISFFIKTRQTT